MVLLRQPHLSTFSTTLHHDPLRIITINSSQIIIRSKTRQIYPQNSSYIRKLYPLNALEDPLIPRQPIIHIQMKTKTFTTSFATTPNRPTINLKALRIEA